MGDVARSLVVRRAKERASGSNVGTRVPLCSMNCGVLIVGTCVLLYGRDGRREREDECGRLNPTVGTLPHP